MRIAIIGSGISGLGSAYYLGQKNHHTVLYEANNYLGGHTRTKTIHYDNQIINVDTGFIVYNEKNYPLLTKLFHELEVTVDKSDMSFGVSINQGAFEWCGRNIGGVFAQKSNLFRPWFYRMLSDIRKFNHHATKAIVNLTDTSIITLGTFLHHLKLSSAFMDYYLLPMAGAIWSCPLKTMLDFPAKSFLTFFHNHGLLTVTQQPQWYTVHEGAKNYVQKIQQKVKNCEIRLNNAVTSVIRSQENVDIIDQKGTRETFDKVIFACHGNHILNLLSQPDPQEVSAFSSIVYQPNTVILHRDMNQMPKRKAAWASWVYQSTIDQKNNHIAITYYMNNLQPHIPRDKPLFVTLNPIHTIPDEFIFDSVVLQHPVFTSDMLNAQQNASSLQGHRHCYYTGAWRGYGFHEDGLRSAMQVADCL